MSTIKLFCLATHIHKLFFSVICLKSVSQRDTAVSSQKGQNPYWTIRTRWHVCVGHNRNAAPGCGSINCVHEIWIWIWIILDDVYADFCRGAGSDYSAAYRTLGDLEWEVESTTVTHSSADWWDLLLPLA